jgi:hypothetical protein
MRATVNSPIATSSAGNEARVIRQVTSIIQPKTGSRSMVMPGARSRRMVHSTVPPWMIMPDAARNTATIHRSSPEPGV